MAQKIASPFGGYYIYPNDPNNLFQQLFGSSKAGAQPEASSELTPAVDIYEDDTAFYASIEMPGASKEHIGIKCTGGNLTINADAQRSAHDNGHWVQHERRVGTYVRTIGFRTDIESDKISAAYSAGILMLTIPKKSDQEQSISISVG